MATESQARLSRARGFVCCVLLVLLLPNPPQGSTRSDSAAESVKSVWQHPLSSWALGIVVPDGAKLEGGGTLVWAGAKNVTAVVRLPNITSPDQSTYVVLSAMGNDRTVFQVAAGIYPGIDRWSVYSWLVTDVDSSSPVYEWLLNSSSPTMLPNEVVSISIIVASPTGWELEVDNEDTGSSTELAFPSNTSVSFASGDQEVLALESYSRKDSTFQQMGNMTLESMLIDGRRIVGGWYPYGGWDAIHSPLFVVGSSSPPSFIFVNLDRHGEANWGYSPPWNSRGWNAPPYLVGLSLLCVLGLVLVALLIHLRHQRGSATGEDRALLRPSTVREERQPRAAGRESEACKSGFRRLREFSV